MVDLKETCGVDDLTLDEVIELCKKHPYKARTRTDKISLYNSLEAIIAEANNLLPYCKSIPEEDEEKHSKIVHEFAEEIRSIRKQFTSCLERHAYPN